jgi:ADP-heptose:LPS heptosyltransferase
VPLVKRAIALPEMTCRVPVMPAEHEYVRSELAKLVDPAARLVLFNHDAGKLLPIRTWPAERFAELARRLLAWDRELVVVLCGVPDAAESAREIVRAVANPRLVDFVGKTRTLVDLVQLYHLSELLVTNDSGPAHFASLTEIASITLFGPETARLYRPHGPRAVSIDKEIACSPCLTAFNHRNSPCKHNQCLEDISVAEVFEHAVHLLGSTVRAGRP